MARPKIRIAVPEKNEVYEVVIDTDANPTHVAQGLAAKLNLSQGSHYLRLRDSFLMVDGTTLDLVSEVVDPFQIVGKAPD